MPLPPSAVPARKLKKPFSIWLALSEALQPAPFIGFALSKSALRKSYSDRFGHELERAGYHAVKVTIR